MTNDYIAHLCKNDNRKQALKEHLLGVAQLCKALANKVGLGDAGELLGLLHDLGKYSQDFQNYIKSAKGLLDPDLDEDFVDAKSLKGKIDHSTAGAQWIWQYFHPKVKYGHIEGQILALSIASHHSGLIDCLTQKPTIPCQDQFTKRMEKSIQRTYLEEVIEKMDPIIQEKTHYLREHLIQQLPLQKTVKRMLSRDREQQKVASFKVGLLARLLLSCLVDADRTDSAEFENPARTNLRLQQEAVTWSILTQRLETHMATFVAKHPVDYHRQAISRHCLEASLCSPGTYTLTVPTGGGKTLASLRFALHHAQKHKMNRVIYVLPYTSIIDQNAQVVRQILEPDGVDPGSVVLEHHSTIMAEAHPWRSKLHDESWHCRVVFTTSVQVLEALFGQGTSSLRRMHELSNAVVIFDEIQTLPVRCVHLFNNAINFLTEECCSTVLLCTATQPLLQEVCRKKGAINIQAELMPDAPALFRDLQRTRIYHHSRSGGWTLAEISTLALEKATETGSCLVIVNTRKFAQNLFELCRAESTVELYHLSTNMCPKHRKAVLKEMCQRLESIQKPLLCISTQLIEAGVDVDFNSVIRCEAGLDSIAQAAGRCNRHGRREVGEVHVVNPKEENLDRVPEIKIGQEKAKRVLREWHQGQIPNAEDPLSPTAMKRYYEYYFFDRKGEMSYGVESGELGWEDTLLNLLSSNDKVMGDCGRNGVKPLYSLRQSFKTAACKFKVIDSIAIGVLVPYDGQGKELIASLCATDKPERAYALLRQAQQYAVNLFPYKLNELKNDGFIVEINGGSGIHHLLEGYYSKDFGLGDSPEGEMEALIR